MFVRSLPRTPNTKHSTSYYIRLSHDNCKLCVFLFHGEEQFAMARRKCDLQIKPCFKTLSNDRRKGDCHLKQG